jgi:flagellar basal-body rod protein FlgC
MPNVNMMEEMLDMINASRAYEANASAVNNAKTMATRAIEMGRR